jgi:hypothetical protein
MCSDGISSLDHIESSNSVVSEYELEKMLNEVVNLWYCLEGGRKTIEYLSEDALCPDWYSNWVSPKCKLEALQLSQQFLLVLKLIPSVISMITVFQLSVICHTSQIYASAMLLFLIVQN